MNRQKTNTDIAGRTPPRHSSATIARLPYGRHPLTTDETRRIVLEMIG